MNRGEDLVIQSKNLIYSAEFQSLHRISATDFSRKRKLPFVKVFCDDIKISKKKGCYSKST